MVKRRIVLIYSSPHDCSMCPACSFINPIILLLLFSLTVHRWQPMLLLLLLLLFTSRRHPSSWSASSSVLDSPPLTDGCVFLLSLHWCFCTASSSLPIPPHCCGSHHQHHHHHALLLRHLHSYISGCYISVVVFFIFNACFFSLIFFVFFSMLPNFLFHERRILWTLGMIFTATPVCHHSVASWYLSIYVYIMWTPSRHHCWLLTVW